MLPPFKILNTNSIADAVHELARLGDQVRVYGGGTELLILLRHNLVRTEYLLNIKTIDELSRIGWQERSRCNRSGCDAPAAGDGYDRS